MANEDVICNNVLQWRNKRHLPDCHYYFTINRREAACPSNTGSAYDVLVCDGNGERIVKIK